MKSAFLADLRRPHPTIQCSSEFRRVLQMFHRPGVHAVAIYRFGSWLQRSSIIVRAILFPVYLFLDHRIRSKWGIEINRHSKIGGGLLVEHYGGIFIDWGSQIGENCMIFHDVTFVRGTDGPKKGHPILGDNVIVYPGARLVGRVVIGNNAIIGPNVVLTRDVPENGVVMVPMPKTILFSKARNEDASSWAGSD